jgi:hypothetical protein
MRCGSTAVRADRGVATDCGEAIPVDIPACAMPLLRHRNPSQAGLEPIHPPLSPTPILEPLTVA